MRLSSREFAKKTGFMSAEAQIVIEYLTIEGVSISELSKLIFGTTKNVCKTTISDALRELRNLHVWRRDYDATRSKHNKVRYCINPKALESLREVFGRDYATPKFKPTFNLGGK